MGVAGPPVAVGATVSASSPTAKVVERSLVGAAEAFSCVAGSDGSAQRNPEAQPRPFGGYQALCPSSRTVSVDFDLPAEGDLAVDVGAQ